MIAHKGIGLSRKNELAEIHAGLPAFVGKL